MRDVFVAVKEQSSDCAKSAFKFGLDGHKTMNHRVQTHEIVLENRTDRNFSYKSFIKQIFYVKVTIILTV